MKKQYKASLSKGRNSWCVIFRHPLCKAVDGKLQLRVRRGLGTSDENEAQLLVDQLTEILSNESLWNISAKEMAESKYDNRIVSAFFDHINPEKFDPWNDREKFLPLPGGNGSVDEYARVQFIGTTGAGKTTLLRQLIGSDPKIDRFPSISAAKTTICDIEIITKEGEFEAVVSFIPKERVRQYIAECVMAATFSKMDGDPEPEVYRRFLEHSEQHFRLSYLLGSPNVLKNSMTDDDLLEDFDDEEEENETDYSLISDEDKKHLLNTLNDYFVKISELAVLAHGYFEKHANELDISTQEATPAEKEVIYEFVENDIYDHEDFHHLVDHVLDEVESKFCHFQDGDFQRHKSGWPTLWKHKTEKREDFIRLINQLSSNYAPNFGRLLTPLVDGMRVVGPFMPTFHNGSDIKIPKLVLMDGKGIGHTADSTTSLSTNITKRFKMVDAILLVDNAAQPMQAAPCSVLRTIVSSGHEAKLIVAFTHFDEVKGDNLINIQAKKEHVVSSFDNAIHAIGKDFGREAEIILRKLSEENVFFFSKIQEKVKLNYKFTLDQLTKLMQAVENKVVPVKPSDYSPVYDIANLIFAIQKATQEFHDRWRGLLGMGAKSHVIAEHWARIKALTRRLGVFRVDEYDTLRPVADLIRLLQDKISVYLNNPLEWDPQAPVDNQTKVTAVDNIRKEVFNRLHDLSSRRILEEQITEWTRAYEHRGTGSTRTRARDMVAIYENAAPIPNEMPDNDANNFLFDLRELISEAIREGGGDIRGWSRSSR